MLNQPMSSPQMIRMLGFLPAFASAIFTYLTLLRAVPGVSHFLIVESRRAHLSQLARICEGTCTTRFAGAVVGSQARGQTGKATANRGLLLATEIDVRFLENRRNGRGKSCNTPRAVTTDREPLTEVCGQCRGFHGSSQRADRLRALAVRGTRTEMPVDRSNSGRRIGTDLRTPRVEDTARPTLSGRISRRSRLHRL